MKTILTLQKFFFLLATAAVGCMACKKTDTFTLTIQQPAAEFSVLVSDPFSGFQMQGTTNYIDSSFYFRNSSDSGSDISYTWDFGDGTTSAEKAPKHSYSKRGSYTVKLIASNKNKAFDTAQQNVSVILGQQVISFGDNTDISPVAIEETSANNFILLSFGGPYNSYAYYLYRLDSLLQPKSKKTLPAAYHLVSMKATSDGNYILAGSAVSKDKSNELIKMTADGTLMWNKVLSADDTYSYAAQTQDGGFAAVGTRSVSTGNNINYNTVVIKTDGNGNRQWEKLLDGEGMTFTGNMVIEQDGVVIAGIKRGNNCSECDSILVVKLDNSGNMVWKSAVMGGMNNFTWWDTHIAKLGDGNYAVTNGYTRGIFFFSPGGTFLDRKLATDQVAAVTYSSDGNLVVLQLEYGNGFRMGITKLTPNGIRQWYAYPDGKEKLSGNNYSCCFDSRPVSISRLHNGGFLVAGEAVLNNSGTNGNHAAILLWELDEAGKSQ